MMVVPDWTVEPPVTLYVLQNAKLPVGAVEVGLFGGMIQYELENAGVSQGEQLEDSLTTTTAGQVESSKPTLWNPTVAFSVTQ